MPGPHLKLEQFQGPLELLLELIQTEQLKITELALAKVTEQFLIYLDTVAENRPEALADFLVVAARLVYLKSRALLPDLPPAEAEDGVGLVDQLKLYQQYAAASRLVARQWEQGAVAYGRSDARWSVAVWSPPLRLTLADLRASMQQLVGRLKPALVLPEVPIARGVSVKEKIFSLWEALRRRHPLRWSELFRGGQNRTEAIVSFLALLELVKERRVAINQPSAFAELTVEPV
ncbi:MAG: segregation/condensation protein A [Candidatus Magasanikbacteria bacterium]|nr:segregation/condensation protein A [Candidatus Magasanikbacteria bacterium]